MKYRIKIHELANPGASGNEGRPFIAYVQVLEWHDVDGGGWSWKTRAHARVDDAVADIKRAHEEVRGDDCDVVDGMGRPWSGPFAEREARKKRGPR